ncbi:cell division protein FtsQ/DivIB [Cognatishimia sp. F0-27]|uniref:cell division protein FtsQ/DivIB n=1 Tax=Cognatishimia sp. F0-27 TaxID=2816855 RepID=UPI001D0C7900|nr:cell division protein FtsQ/DivIB [Cognatishimia sp. F0-27]MCC1492524.1 cell division protein FtsQ/DivIB [Cognatishimia sp. F0-27]
MRQVRRDPEMARLDPSVSRAKYRIERLMLTPLFRFAMRVGVPCALGFGAVTWWASVEENRTAFNLMVADVRAQFESRPEFQVKLMAIDGASPQVAEAIRATLPVGFPVSSFDLDLETMQQAVIELDPVRSADLRIKQGGVLQVDVTERVPAVLWRSDAGLSVLDADGVRAAWAGSRAEYATLPVIAGEGAEKVVDEALALYAAAQPIMDRLRGFERMGARRWDVVLDRDQRIMLPEEEPVLAFERAIAMQQIPTMTLLDRDIVAVDLRLPHRTTFRMTAEAAAEFRKFKKIEAGGDPNP